jgi:hypothetical protein
MIRPTKSQSASRAAIDGHFGCVPAVKGSGEAGIVVGAEADGVGMLGGELSAVVAGESDGSGRLPMEQALLASAIARMNRGLNFVPFSLM